MRTAQSKHTAQTRSHRPRAITVFAAAFVAGAAAAVGVNRALDVRLAQSKPRVESEAIFVALRSLPQGAPVTVWDVALRDWPKAMMPASALRASDTFSGHLLKHPLREGQPLLSIQLAPAGQNGQPAATPSAVSPPASYTQVGTPVVPAAEGDLWSPAEPVKAEPHIPAQQPAPAVASPVVSAIVSPVVVQPAEANPIPSVAMAPTTAPAQEQTATSIPSQETTPQQEPVASTEPTPAESAPIAAVASAADAPAMTDTTATVSNETPASSAATPTITTAQDDGVAPAAEALVTDSPAPAAEPTSTTGTVPQPQAGAPEPTSTTSVTSPPESAATSDIPEPVVASPTPTPTAPVAPAPIAAVPPTPAAPGDAPRPTYSRYLVVPENIAVQADASFAARPTPSRQPAEAQAPAGQQTASRSGSNAVRPLPSTATANRGSQTRPQSGPQNGPQGRPPQRQGRQAQPVNPGIPANTVPQPRLGAAMFPNLSAGIDAIEGRFRGDQPAQGQAPNAAQTRPLTAR